MNRINERDAPVGHCPAGIIPEIPKCWESRLWNTPAVFVEGNLGGGSQPHVPIESGRRIPVSRFAVAFTLVQSGGPGLAPCDLSRCAAVHDFLSLEERRHGPLHRAPLDYAVVLARG